MIETACRSQQERTNREGRAQRAPQQVPPNQASNNEKRGRGEDDDWVWAQCLCAQNPALAFRDQWVLIVYRESDQELLGPVWVQGQGRGRAGGTPAHPNACKLPAQLAQCWLLLLQVQWTNPDVKRDLGSAQTAPHTALLACQVAAGRWYWPSADCQSAGAVRLEHSASHLRPIVDSCRLQQTCDTLIVMAAC
jgi:hypothetical protein